MGTGLQLPRLTMDQSPYDYGGVLATLAFYFDALHLRDAERMRKVWHPSCHLKRPDSTTEEGLVDISAERFLAIVAESTSEKPVNQHVQDQVLGIDFAGPDTAMAKLEISLGSTVYTDFLSLLRLQDGW